VEPPIDATGFHRRPRGRRRYGICSSHGSWPLRRARKAGRRKNATNSRARWSVS